MKKLTYKRSKIFVILFLIISVVSSANVLLPDVLPPCPETTPDPLKQLSIDYSGRCPHCLPPTPTKQNLIPTIELNGAEGGGGGLTEYVGTCQEYDKSVPPCTELELQGQYRCFCPREARTSTPVPETTNQPTLEATISVEPTQTETPDDGYIYPSEHRIQDWYISEQLRYGYFEGEPENLLAKDNEYYIYDINGNLGAFYYWVYFDQVIPAGSQIEYSATGCRDKADDYCLSTVVDGNPFDGRIIYGNSSNNNATTQDAQVFAIRLDNCTGGAAGIDYIRFYLPDLNPTSTPTPTLEPTQTPTPDNSCNTWEYLTEEQAASYTAMTISQGECIVMVPEFSIDLPAYGELIPSVQMGVPGISYCPKLVTMGTFQLAGFEIPTDALLIPAVVFLILLIFRL